MANRIVKADNIFRTTLTAGVSTTDLSFPFASVTGLELPQYLVIDPEVPASTEIVFFDGNITVLTVSTTALANRNQEGSVGAVAHDAGAEVWASPVGQNIEDLHDRVTLHAHEGTALSGTQLEHGGLAGLATDSHPFYIPTDGSRPMTGDLNLGGNNLLNPGDLDMGGNDITNVGNLTAETLIVNDLPVVGMGVADIQTERLNFSMQSGSGMRNAFDLGGCSAPPGWEAGYIFIVVHLHLSSFSNSWRLDTLFDGTGTNRSAGVGQVFLTANDDFFDGGSQGGSGAGQLFSNAAGGTDASGYVMYYLFRTE